MENGCVQHRRIEVLREGNVILLSDPSDLNVGEVFRMFEPGTCERVVDPDGADVWQAITKPELEGSDGLYHFTAMPIYPIIQNTMVPFE